jgi:hypothetical protein
VAFVDERSAVGPVARSREDILARIEALRGQRDALARAVEDLLLPADGR